MFPGDPNLPDRDRDPFGRGPARRVQTYSAPLFRADNPDGCGTVAFYAPDAWGAWTETQAEYVEYGIHRLELFANQEG